MLLHFGAPRPLLPWPLRFDEPPCHGAEGGAVDLDFAVGALDADGGLAGVEAVGIGGHAQVGEGDAVGGVGGVVAVGGAGGGGAGGGGEGEDHGGHFVGARGVVGCYCGQDFGGLAGRWGEGVVEGLEEPG